MFWSFEIVILFCRFVEGSFIFSRHLPVVLCFDGLLRGFQEVALDETHAMATGCVSQHGSLLASKSY